MLPSWSKLARTILLWVVQVYRSVLNDEFLDHVRLIATQLGALGKALGIQPFFVVDREFGSLRSLCRTRTLFPFLAFCIRLNGFQPARLDIRTRLLPLELGIRITQLLNGLFEFGHSVRQLPNDRQQRLHEWSAFFWPDLGKLELHT